MKCIRFLLFSLLIFLGGEHVFAQSIYVSGSETSFVNPTLSGSKLNYQGAISCWTADVGSGRSSFYIIDAGKTYDIPFKSIYPIKRVGLDASFPGPSVSIGSISCQFAYDFTTPNPAGASGTSGQTSTCANNPVSMYSTGNWALFSDGTVKTTVVWQYDFDDLNNWLTLDESSNLYSFSFIPSAKFEILNREPHKIRFRCMAKAQYGSALPIETGYSAPSNSIQIIPPPPTLQDTSFIVKTLPCYGELNGGIYIPAQYIKGNGYVNTYRWILREGDKTDPCVPGKDCGKIAKESEEPVNLGTALSIDGLGAGQYTLWIVNPSGEAGNCFSPYKITLPTISPVELKNAGSKDITCFGDGDGVIKVLATGGKGSAAGYTYTLYSEGSPLDTKTGGAEAVSFTNLQPGKYQVRAVGGGCPYEAVFDITLVQPDLMQGSIAVVQPICNVPGDGMITVNATGATNYKYTLLKDDGTTRTLVTTATTNTFAGLSAGFYTVKAENNNHLTCIPFTDTVTIFAPTPLTIDITTRDTVSCFNGSDGAIQLTGSGGTGIFRYTFGTLSNTTGTFTGLRAGSYTATLRNQDASCTDILTQTIEIYERPQLHISLQVTDVTCNGFANGQLSATFGGGSGAYKITWQKLTNNAWQTGSFWFETDTFIDELTPGTYRAILTDAKASCSVISEEVQVNEPDALLITKVTALDAVCFEDGGSIDITTTGGNGNMTYSYLFNDETTYTDYLLKSGIHSTGDYQVRVIDYKGCTITDPTRYRITLPDSILVFNHRLSNYNGLNISCTGNTDGSIQLSANGGTSPYEFKIEGELLDKKTQLPAGFYNVQVMDARGCIRPRTIELTEAHLVFNPAIENVACNGAATGSLQPAIGGGAAPYWVTLNNKPIGFNTKVSNLAAGEYTLRVTDANECSKDTVVKIVNAYDALKFENILVNDIRCIGEAGNIAITTTGGDGDYRYTLNNVAYNNGDPLTAGAYKVTVTDGQGCVLVDNVTRNITNPPSAVQFTAVLSDYNGYNVSCKDGNNGYAAITATGGNGADYKGYTYAFDSNTFGTSDTIRGINIGTHTLHVQDRRGCIASADYTFTESPDRVGITLVSTEGVVCANTPGGVITVAGNGGLGDLKYGLDGSSWSASPVFTGLTGGDHTFWVIDVNGCTNSMIANVPSSIPEIIVDDIHLDDIKCFGEQATIAITAHGGSAPLMSEYRLNNSSYTAFDNTTRFNAGNYTIRIVDAAGCTTVKPAIVKVTAPTAPITTQLTTSNYNGVQISCKGLSDGAINLTANGGGGTYQYSINTADNTFTGLPAGTYTVQVTDNRGCVNTQSVILKEPANKVGLMVTSLKDLKCELDITGEIGIAGSGGTQPYSYNINNGNWQNNGYFTTLTAGTHQLFIKDANGCIETIGAALTTTDPAITATPDITPANCFGESNGAVNVILGGGDGVFTSKWETTGTTGSEIKNVAAGDYLLSVTDGQGCSHTFTFNVPQPDKLQFTTSAAAICDGLSDGIMTVSPGGGAGAYVYSIGNGDWQLEDQFTDLAAGTYQVSIRDFNGCRLDQEITIPKANIKPDVNFLVSSTGSALDTLVIKEISLPAPDNAVFTYSPNVTYLGENMIRFTSEGEQWVEMTATFGQCTYVLRKEIVVRPYDPSASPIYTVPVSVIDTVTLAPNPNNGTFNFKVTLSKKQQVVANVYDISGNLVARKQYEPSLSVADQFVLTNVLSGTYLLRVVSVNDSKDVLFIISR